MNDAGEYRGGKGFGYARVHVCRRDNAPTASVSVALDGDAWNDQLKGGGYGDWIAAAIFGCRFAFDVAGVASGSWEIRRIVGIDSDTTPPFVAIAAARAVWKVCSYPATEIETEKLTDSANTFHYEPPVNPE